MKKSSLPSRPDSSEITSLFDRVADIVESARGRVLRIVNHETVTTYWLTGREIVQTLQGGEARAQYGNAVIADLATRLAQHYGTGFSAANLKNFRQFCLTYTDRADPIGYPPGSELPPNFHPSLSWSHYRALMRVDNRSARQFYESEAVWANCSPPNTNSPCPAKKHSNTKLSVSGH